MMNWKFSLSALLSLLTLQTAGAQFNPVQAVEMGSKSLIAQASTTNTEAFFQRAEQELSKDYFMLYRVVERIARANQLDNLPWRLYISDEYEVNAFATDINLIAFYSGLLDRLDGDPHAIACVVGHEMAHHTQNHIAVGSAERQRILEQLRQEAIDEVVAEEQDLKADLEALAIGDALTSGAGRVVGRGGILGTAVNVLGSAIAGSRQRRIDAALERIQAIYAEKEAQVQKEWRELSHRQEFEADEVGYQYMVRAGFNPQGCQTAKTMLTRLGVTASDTHPATPDRIQAIRQLATKYPTETLQREGRANLDRSPNPLTYDLSRDRATLRVNSRTGSSGFNQAFPD
ncbi:M48 family metallopeptidase [Spirulina subsalsa FACHB-351]|uniref:M48 family metallopeptidase n=1 Tax=Spirulina subsalsa FACHB-351 TaxID=234711 RepID=A0ABT3L2S4_9CYAN|nr:M48 family metallopeptidase [Spirulina subsalsa]MCW6035810.1 M48 family metallopeptidase [Spirulina subsalsa FACHB-351]